MFETIQGSMGVLRKSTEALTHTTLFLRALKWKSNPSIPDIIDLLTVLKPVQSTHRNVNGTCAGGSTY
ncbi:hypothetical protein Hanom_Chr09g00807831 [Helianthus anomalus]